MACRQCANHIAVDMVDAVLLADARWASREAKQPVRTLWSHLGETRRQITLLAGEELPFRRNLDLVKIWRVCSGIGHADIAESDVTLMPGSVVTIAPGRLHQIENRGPDPLVLEEVRRRADAVKTPPHRARS